MSKAQIIITWDSQAAKDTTVRLTMAWKRLSGLEKADCLTDAAAEIDEAYNKAVRQMEKEFLAQRKNSYIGPRKA